MNENMFIIEFVREDELVPVELLYNSVNQSEEIVTEGQMVCF